MKSERRQRDGVHASPCAFGVRGRWVRQKAHTEMTIDINVHAEQHHLHSFCRGGLEIVSAHLRCVREAFCCFSLGVNRGKWYHLIHGIIGSTKMEAVDIVGMP